MGIYCANCDVNLGKTPTRVCHCSGCCRTFSSIGPFDLHRRRGKCEDPIVLKDDGGNPVLFFNSARGLWQRPTDPDWAEIFKKKESASAGR